MKSRNQDYYVAPLPILTAIIAIYLAIQSDVSWLSVYAIASLGGGTSYFKLWNVYIKDFTKLWQKTMVWIINARTNLV